MNRWKVAPAAMLLTVAALTVALVAAGAGSREAAGQPFKAAWIYVGPHNDARLVAGPRRGPAVRAENARIEGRDDLQGEGPRGPQVAQVIEGLIRDGQQDHLRHVVRLPVGDGLLRRRRIPTSSSRWRRAPPVLPNMAEYYGAGEDSIYLSGMAAGAASKSRRDRLRRAVRDPGGDPAHERVHARCAGDASGGEGQDRVDELLVRRRTWRRRRHRACMRPAPT